MKRSDLRTDFVLVIVQRYRTDAWEVLCGMGFPPKVVRAAFQREVKAGRLDYGVCIERPFLVEDPASAPGPYTPSDPAAMRSFADCDHSWAKPCNHTWPGEQVIPAETVRQCSMPGFTLPYQDYSKYCPPGVHSMFDFCPGRDVCEDGDDA